MAKRRIYLDEATRNYGTGQPDGIIANIINSAKEKYSQSVAEDIKRRAKKQNLTAYIIRKRLYDNLEPYGYENAKERLESAIFENKKQYNHYGTRDDTFAEYLGIPKEQRHRSSISAKVIPSSYTPTMGREQKSYKTLKFPEFFGDNWHNIVDTSGQLDFNKNMVTSVSPWGEVFGQYTVGRGVDKDKGEYRSVYDLWNLAPTTGYGEDESEGLGKPIHFYDRVYLNDYYGVPTEKTLPKYGDYYGGYIPEVIVNGNRKHKLLGGRINKLKYGGKLKKDYYDIMYKVAKDNYKNWGFKTPDAAFTHAINDPTYNYEAFYKENPNATNNAETHWPDTYKTVYHPTFSNESKYSGKVSQYNPTGITGGSWYNNPNERGYFNNGIFIPSWEQTLDRLDFKNGGTIHIKKENRGKFTATMKRTGKSAEELSHSKNPLTRKRAIFALNARKWNRKKK